MLSKRVVPRVFPETTSLLQEEILFAKEFFYSMGTVAFDTIYIIQMKNIFGKEKDI